MRIADALAIAALLLSVSILVFGGFTIGFGPLRITSHSPWRALFVALVLIVMRHWRRPAPAVHRRLFRWWLFPDEGRDIVVMAVVSRMAVLVAAYFAVVTIGLPPPDERLARDPLLKLPVRFDAQWYGSIAMYGYRFTGDFDRQHNIAFFPAFPLIVRAAGAWTGAYRTGVPRDVREARALWAGVLVSIAAFAWAAVYLRRLASETIGPVRGDDAVALLAAYPFAVAFSAAYTESLFLLGTLAAFHHFRRREWTRAALWGGLVGLTRPNGCLLSVVLACLMAEHLWRARTSWREYPIISALLAAAAPGLTMLAHTLYLHQVTGVWFAWMRVQAAWGRSFRGFEPVSTALDRIAHDGLLQVIADTPADALNAIALIFALALLPAVLRYVGTAGVLFVLLNVLPPFFTGGVLSMGRFTSTLFPIFLALAAILPARAKAPLIIAFAVGQGLVAVVFFTIRGLF